MIETPYSGVIQDILNIIWLSKNHRSLKEFGSPSFDFCWATFFAGLSAGRFAGRSSASFGPAKRPAKGTGLPSYVCMHARMKHITEIKPEMHARMKHITQIKPKIDATMFFYLSEYIQF